MLARQVARRAGTQQRAPGAVALVRGRQGLATRQRQHAADGGLRHYRVTGALRGRDGDPARMQALRAVSGVIWNLVEAPVMSRDTKATCASQGWPSSGWHRTKRAPAVGSASRKAGASAGEHRMRIA
ncbi:hypothetical protein G6F68_009554 [Rhizopus microsporus]|nr:hypothetical protein G6F68_009554 [Rhizopus microsporus]